MLKKLLLIFILFLFSSGAWAANYYVDSASSGGDGTTTATSGAHAAFATIASVNAASFSADDFVYLKDDCIWNETLIVPSSGISGHPITFDHYGSGTNHPILRLAISRAGAQWNKTVGQTNVYQSDITSYSLVLTNGVVWYTSVPGQFLTQTSSVANVDATAGTCYYNSGENLIYIHTVDSSSPIVNGDTYWIGNRVWGILTNGKDYINLNNIDVYYISAAGIETCAVAYATPSSNINITGCNAYYDAGDGILGIGANIAFTNCKVYYSTFKGFIALDVGGALSSSNISFTNCEYATNNIWGEGVFSATPTAFYIEGADGTSITSCTISGNCYRGIMVGRIGTNYSDSFTLNGLKVTGSIDFYIVDDDMGASNVTISGINNTASPYTVNHNYALHFINTVGLTIKNNNIVCGGTSYTAIFHSVPATIEYNILTAPFVVIWPQSGADGTTIYNNTITTGTYGVYAGAGISTTIKNNIFYNCVTMFNLSTNPTSDYNCGYGYTRWSNLGATLALWRIASGQDANSFNSDPLFVSGSDYHLQVNLSATKSPCIDAGIDVGLTSDYEGNPVYKGVAPDIGVYEWNGSRFGVSGVFGASGRFGVPGY